MSIEQLADRIGDYGKDVKLNLKNILSDESQPGLTLKQVLGTALACAYATKDVDVIRAIEERSQTTLSAEDINGAKIAASLMAMNNVYYRTMHLAENQELSQMPAKLRMTLIANPGIPKVDFETYCLAVSAIAGCGKCISAHIHELTKAEMTMEGIHSSIRIASVVNSASQALSIARLSE